MAISSEDYLKQPYSRIIVPDDAGGYSAEILEFPGCFAQGDTPDEAYNNLEEAAKGWIESSLERGLEIPAPSLTIGYNGRIALRLPKSTHRLASQMAERDGVSLNQFLVSSVSARIGAEDLYGRIVQHFENKIREWFVPYIQTPVAISAVSLTNVFYCQINQPVISQISPWTDSNRKVPLMK